MWEANVRSSRRRIVASGITVRVPHIADAGYYVSEDPATPFSSAERLFEDVYVANQYGDRNYDVAADGRFLMIKAVSDGSQEDNLVAVENWFEELKRLAPIPEAN